MGIQFKRLNHLLVGIPPGTSQEAIDFYGGILGLKQIPGEHPGGAIWFLIGDIELHLREEEMGPPSLRHPAFEVSNLESARHFLELKGVEVANSSRIEGRERIFFRDPFGNRVELIEFG